MDQEIDRGPDGAAAACGDAPGEATPAAVERLERERDLYLRLLHLGAADAIEPLLREALQLVVEITGALRAYVEVHDPRSDGGPQWWLAHDCSSEDLDAIRAQISRGVIAASLAAGRTIETSSALLDDRFRERASVRLGRIEAVLCTPIGADPPLGAVYLAGTRRDREFPADVREKLELLAFQIAPLADRLLARQREARESDPTRAVRASLRADQVVGRSDAVAAMLRQVAVFAPLDIPVMILGPTGAGRALLARVLHENGPRAGAPLVELACSGASPAALGHALRDAGSGALLLRDVDALPPVLQGQLLAFLETGRIRDASGEEWEPAARILVTAQPEPALRADLRRRLQALCIHVPDLAERTGDLPELARWFALRGCERRRAPRLGLSAGALREIEAREWHGQVAELEACIEAAIDRAPRSGARQIEAAHLFDERARGALAAREASTFQEATREFQRAFLAGVLAEMQWNIAACARRLGLTRSHVYNLIRAFGLERGAGSEGE